MTYLNGDQRRANILRFVRDYSLQHGYGPTEAAIREHVGYRGHGLRSRHLDKMPGIYRAENGRWMATVNNQSETTKVLIKSFRPLNVILPPGKELVGKVRLVLPDIHIQVCDLSMGIDLLKGAHLGADVSVMGLEMEFSEPVDVGDFMAFIIASQEQLEEMWKLGQEQFNEKGALL